MKLLIKVTKDIIEKSSGCPVLRTYSSDDKKSYSKQNCMVSLAVREIFPHALTTTYFELDGLVGAIYPFGDEKDDITSIDIPHKVVQIINRFDTMSSYRRLREIDPFEFVVDLPDAVIDKIGLAEVDRILSTSTSLSKVLQYELNQQ